jgi:hypothetical protein
VQIRADLVTSKPLRLFGVVAFFAAVLAHGAGFWKGGLDPLLDLIAGLAGGALVVYAFVVLRRKRMIENVPSSRIRSVAMGLAEIVGAARQRTPLTAHLTGMPCVFYRYLIEQEERGSKGQNHWRTVEQGQSSDPFQLQDPTGTILVDPAGAEIVLRQAHRKIERPSGWFSKRRRYTEWRIVPGQRVYALGTVRKLRDMARETRAALQQRLRELKRDPQSLASFDADRDGRISTEEWGSAVRVVQDRLLQEAVSAPAPEPQDDLVLGKGETESTFVIADRGEKALVRMMALKVGGALLAGGAIGLLTVVSLLARSGALPSPWVIPWKDILD